MPLVVAWARAFLVTLIVEQAVAVPLLARAEPSRARRVGVVLVANVATHPAVWFVFPELPFLSFATKLGLSEAWAVGFEAFVYRLVFPRAGLAGAIAASALANAASFAAGSLLRAATGWI